MYRGTGLQYKIRKTTVGNKTGDNYSITIPRILAEQFDNCYFKISVSGCSITFTSGCKLSAADIKENTEENKNVVFSYDKEGVVVFR